MAVEGVKSPVEGVNSIAEGVSQFTSRGGQFTCGGLGVGELEGIHREGDHRGQRHAAPCNTIHQRRGSIHQRRGVNSPAEG
eukprot:43810-Prorocentrum_minimum.AAC.1